MDVLFAFTGDKFAVIVTDTASVQQIIVQKDDMEKTMDLDSHKLMALSGPKGDCVYFGEYIQANMKLYELRNGSKLSTAAAANFTRNNLAEALRKGPYQVNILLAGYDADEDEPVLYGPVRVHDEGQLGRARVRRDVLPLPVRQALEAENDSGGGCGSGGQVHRGGARAVGHGAHQVPRQDRDKDGTTCEVYDCVEKAAKAAVAADKAAA